MLSADQKTRFKNPALTAWGMGYSGGGVCFVEYCCVSGSLAYSRILYEQIGPNISTLTHCAVRKISRRFAPGRLSILGYFCVFRPFAYLRIAGFPIPELFEFLPHKIFK